MQTGRPIKRWKYSDKAVDVRRYECTCSKKFNFYEGYGKTWTNPKPKLETESMGLCKGICKKFKVKKPTKVGRYESGQVHCHICDIWMDHKGAHVKGDLPATEELTGWFCNCCNYRVRRKPRKKKYKEALRAKTDPPRKIADKIKSRIPKEHELPHVVLRICKDGKPHATRVMLDEIADEFGLGERERNFTGGGKETLLSSRLRWAIYYLKKADLVTQSRGSITITDSGCIILKRNPPKMDRKFLQKVAIAGPLGTDSRDGSKRVAKDGGKMNSLIASALDLIKADIRGVYLSDLKRTLKISDADKVRLLPKLARIEGVSKKEIRDKGVLLDVLLKYG